MKKSFVAVAMIMAAFVMVFTSCSKEKSKLIVGSWSSIEGSYIEEAEEGTMNVPADAYVFTFNSDNTLIIRVNIMGFKDEIKFNYSIDGDQVVIEEFGKMDIVNLNSKNLILEFDSNSIYDEEMDEEMDEGKAHLEFKKVK